MAQQRGGTVCPHPLRSAAGEEDTKDPEAAVASGSLDWLVERVLIPARNEIREWGFKTALAVGIPLDQHPAV